MNYGGKNEDWRIGLSKRPSDYRLLGDKFLRVSKHYDGLAYDVLTVENTKLLKVEVKSREKSPPEVFLPENEKRRAAECLKMENEAEKWRLVLFLKKSVQIRYVDITDKVQDAIQNRPYTRDAPVILAPVDWVIRFE